MLELRWRTDRQFSRWRWRLGALFVFRSSLPMSNLRQGWVYPFMSMRRHDFPDDADVYFLTIDGIGDRRSEG